MHSCLIQALVNHMFTGGFDHPAANLVALLQVGLVAHPFCVVVKIGALNAAYLTMLLRVGLPGLDTLDHLEHSIRLEFCLRGFLPGTREFALFRVHGVGYLGKMLAGMIEIQYLYRSPKLTPEQILYPQRPVAQHDDLLGRMIPTAMRQRAQERFKGLYVFQRRGVSAEAHSTVASVFVF